MLRSFVPFEPGYEGAMIDSIIHAETYHRDIGFEIAALQQRAADLQSSIQGAEATLVQNRSKKLSLLVRLQGLLQATDSPAKAGNIEAVEAQVSV